MRYERQLVGMEERSRSLRIMVPATSANLGAGFDVFGLALDMHNVFTVAPAKETVIDMSGYTGDLPRDSTNLFSKAFRHLYSLAGRSAPELSIRMDLRLPPGSGLGSSATAVVGGLVAANTFMGKPFGEDMLLKEAVKLEHGRHADNVAPALMGGLVVNALDGEQIISVRVPFPQDVKAVLFVPDFPMDTVQGRALMPQAYEKADVVFNTSRVALFLAALGSGRYDLLKTAMQDRMHQPYRAQIFPLLPALIDAALGAGAHGACLSGGGSAVLALATERFEEIEQALTAVGEKAGLIGNVFVLDIDRKGAQADWVEEGEQA